MALEMLTVLDGVEHAPEKSLKSFAVLIAVIIDTMLSLFRSTWEEVRWVILWVLDCRLAACSARTEIFNLAVAADRMLEFAQFFP